jgi:4-hydroxy-3-polyprenylbenzoate decarboxylase
MHNIIVGITGASGALYARRLIECLVQAPQAPESAGSASGHGAGAGSEPEIAVHVVMSPMGRRLLADELGISPPTVESILGRPCERVVIHNYNDLGSRLASGSFPTRGMVICPCSSNTLGALASGLGGNLLNRAAQVTLKERRRLVLIYREMPMSLIDLQNAQRLTEAGAVFCPASPGFYMLPQDIGDVVDFVVGKILDLVGVAHALNTRWEPGKTSHEC